MARHVPDTAQGPYDAGDEGVSLSRHGDPADWRQLGQRVTLLRDIPAFRGLSWDVAGGLLDRHDTWLVAAMVEGGDAVAPRAPRAKRQQEIGQGRLMVEGVEVEALGGLRSTTVTSAAWPLEPVDGGPDRDPDGMRVLHSGDLVRKGLQ